MDNGLIITKQNNAKRLRKNEYGTVELGEIVEEEEDDYEYENSSVGIKFEK